MVEFALRPERRCSGGVFCLVRVIDAPATAIIILGNSPWATPTDGDGCWWNLVSHFTNRSNLLKIWRPKTITQILTRPKHQSTTFPNPQHGSNSIFTPFLHCPPITYRRGTIVGFPDFQHSTKCRLGCFGTWNQWTPKFKLYAITVSNSNGTNNFFCHSKCGWIWSRWVSPRDDRSCLPAKSPTIFQLSWHPRIVSQQRGCQYTPTSGCYYIEQNRSL